MTTPAYEFVDFFPSDNVSALSQAVSHNLVSARESPLSLCRAQPKTSAHNFLTTYLRHRSRWWEDAAISASPALIALDEAVIRALAGGARASPPVTPRLEVSSWFDFASLCGASNSGPVRAVLDVAISGGIVFELRGALTSSAGVLSSTVAEAAAAAAQASAAPDTVAQAVSLATDTLCSIGSLLSLSPAASYALQPPDALCDGSLGLLAPGSLLYEIAVAYEHTLPTLAAAAVSAKGTSSLKLSLLAASHGALAALRGVLDSCYSDALRAAGVLGGAGGGGGGSNRAIHPTSVVIPRSGAARTQPSAIVTALAGLCEAASSLSVPAPPSLSTCNGRSDVDTENVTWFMDAARLFEFRDTFGPLVDGAARAGYISKELASRTAAAVVGAVIGRPLKDVVSESGDQQIASVRDVLPDMSTADILAALKLSNGDVTAAIERLLVQGQGGGGGLSNDLEGGQSVPVDSDLAARTLALVAAQEVRAAEAREEASRQRSRYGGWGLNADEARSAWLEAASRGVSAPLFADDDDDGSEIESEPVPWGAAMTGDDDGKAALPVRAGGGGDDDSGGEQDANNRGGLRGRGGRGHGGGGPARGARSGLTAREAANKTRQGNVARQRGADKKRRGTLPPL